MPFSSILAFLLVLFSACSAFAQTQVGTLTVVNPTYMAIDTDAAGTRWLYVSNHGDLGATNGGVVWKFNLSTGSTTGIPLTTHGTGDGQFIMPDGIAVDPATHDLFVADRYMERVQRIKNDGTFVMKWGSATAGAPDELHGPCGVALDGSGALYVTEHGYWNGDPAPHVGQHVSKFTFSGSGASTVVTRAWRIGGFGNGNGEFNSTGPYGIAVTGGRLYVGDAFNYRIQVFDTATGAYQSQFGIPGGAEPLGVSLDASGALWIGETSNDAAGNFNGQGAIQQVQKYATDGTFSGTTLAATPGSLSAFYAIVDSTTNRAYVSDYQNNRVVIYSLGAAPSPVPVVTNASVSGTVGTPIASVQVSATNSPTSFSAPGLAPYGLSIDASGVISGTPTATASNAVVQVTASNASGTSTAANITLNLAGTTHPAGPYVTEFYFPPHSSQTVFKIAFSEPVTGVDASDFIFTASGSNGQFDNVTQDDPSHYTLHFTFFSGAPGTFMFDIKSSGTGIVGVNSGLPFTGGGYTRAIVPVTPHVDAGHPELAPVVSSFVPDTTVANTVNFVVTFNKETFNIQPANIAFNTTGSATATLGLIEPADNTATRWIIPVTFGGSGTISLTLSNTNQTISDGTYNYYVGPDTSTTYTIPSSVVPNAPYVNNAVVSGSVGTAITPVTVFATNTPTQFDAPQLATYGLAIDSAGVITGNPTATATDVHVDVTATNAGGTSNTATITLELSGSGGPPPTDTTPPTVSSFVVGTHTAASVNFTLTFSEPVSGVDASDFTLGGTAAATASISSLSPTAGPASTYTIPVNFTATSGTLTLTLKNSGNGIVDAAGNALALSSPLASGTYTIPTTGGGVPVLTNVTVTGTVGTAISAITVPATNSPTHFDASGLATYGLAIDNAGVISGTPSRTAAGATVNVTASNASGTSAAAIITLNLQAAPPPPPPPPPPTPAPEVTAGTITVTVGGNVSYAVSATNDPTSFSISGQPAGITISNLGMISGTVTTAGTYQATVTGTNDGGSGSATITFKVLKQQKVTFLAPVGPVIVGEAFTLGATSDADLPITYKLISGPATISGNTALISTAAQPVVIRATAAGDATYAAATADVTVVASKKAQQIDTTPVPTTAHTDGKLTLAATSSSGLPITYTVISGPATVSGNTLTFTGTGTVTLRAVQDGNGTYDSAVSTVTITANPVPRLINISSRAKVTAKDADGATIAGFVVSGDAPKQILVRAVGPSLSAFGVTAPLADPTLKLVDSKGVVVATNSGWKDDAQISAAGDGVGAFKLKPGSRDAAVLVTLAPGTYTAQVQSDANSGTVLIEVYDVTANAPVPTKDLINISTRGVAATNDDALFGGFVVSGNEPKKVLIRAVGPGLVSFGVNGVLADPMLTIHDSKGTVIAGNDNWETQVGVTTGGTPQSATVAANLGTVADITAAEHATGAFPLAAGSTDAAMVLTLQPGAYTAIVTGATRGKGNVLVEVYEVP